MAGGSPCAVHGVLASKEEFSAVRSQLVAPLICSGPFKVPFMFESEQLGMVLSPAVMKHAARPCLRRSGGLLPPDLLQWIELTCHLFVCTPAQATDHHRAGIDAIQPQRPLDVDLVDRCGDIGRQAQFGG